MPEKIARRCTVVNTPALACWRSVATGAVQVAELSHIEQPARGFAAYSEINSSSKTEHHRMRRHMRRKEGLMVSGGAGLLRTCRSLNSRGLVANVGLITLLYAPGASAQVSPSLGNAGSYAVLAGSQITNTGATTIQGNAGISPGIGPPPHFSGFGTVVFTAGGSVHDADIPAAQAQAANTAVFGALDQGCTFTYPGAFGELAGQNLIPGVYCATQFRLSGGVLTLTGAASNTWIFKSASDLIISGGAAARVISPACTVWWRVVSSASFDANSTLVGNILASTSITMAAGAALNGRAFARTAAVTLSSNTIGGACSASAIGVPTLSEWAFIMLAALLAVAGAVALRMRTSA
jgi:hypothetical protein